MRKTAERASLDQWYCIEALKDIAVGRAANRLLGTDLAIVRNADGDITATMSCGTTIVTAIMLSLFGSTCP